MTVVAQYFANIAAMQNMGVLWQIWLYEIYWGISLICQNTTTGYMEHGLKDIAFYVKKHITTRAVCYSFPVVRDKPLGAPAFVRLVYCHISEDSQSNILFHA